MCDTWTGLNVPQKIPTPPRIGNAPIISVIRL